MDAKIKAAKAKMDKDMEGLMKADKKRDKKCEYDAKMAKKKKK
jgi:hypothetical protein|uniref:Uncharacterized protein n=1 Tax=uncultured Caudovirales phage TaxID=2100421 RepID=A0A6J5L1M9_9CAUD|nr:hypothetical protein UFOVP88_3 [uncultured Caudovirales phage]